MAENKDKALQYKKKNIFETSDEKTKSAIEDFATRYKGFLQQCLTERECSEFARKLAEENGFSKYQFGDGLQAGDKRFFINRDKGIVLFKMGKKNIEENGLRIVVAHIDSPRIDIKQVPMYESDGICFLKTHYYGGIKKYQWTSMPLSLHGVVILGNGEKVTLRVGDDDSEPSFYITDLLPHLPRKSDEVVSGEQLNVIIGGKGTEQGDTENKIKQNILKILNEKYNMTEEDFLSAELSAVPSVKPKDIGFDKAFIGGYGHDDRCCAFPALQAILDVDNENSCMVILVDKEEIGSEGNTGMKSKIFEDIIEEVCISQKANTRLVRMRSMCISSDVTAGYDPNFADVFERRNSALMSCGTCMCKFTGSRGKSGSNDASAEMIGRLRAIFADNNVVWQTAELGKVDQGGGGTVAKFISQLNIDTVDMGVPVLSMHSPYELISKADLYSMYTADLAFLK